MPRGAPDYQPWTNVQRFAATGGATPYEQKITVPANTVVGAPVSQDITLVKGFVSHVGIRFPHGSSWMMGLAIFNGATQLWPGTAGGWFYGDGELTEWDTEYDVPLVAGVRKLTIKGYNDDDSYAHAALIRMWVVALP
jgi:hypothetical protein